MPLSLGSLVEGSWQEALERLFVEELGWSRADGAVASGGGMTAVLTGKGDVHCSGDEERLLLSWRHGDTRFTLPVDRRGPSEATLARLGCLRLRTVVRETGGRSSLDECFDPRAVASSFLEDYRRLFDAHVGAVSSSGRRVSEEESRSVLNRFLLRVLLVAFLQTRDWLVFDGRTDYLQALYASWKSSPGGHLFHQRLALAFFNALDEPRVEARSLLSSQIGSVPHIGGGLFAQELFEKELGAGKGLAMFPEQLFEDLFGVDGLLSRYDFVITENKPNEKTVAVTPEAMGAVLSAFLQRDAAPVFEETASHRATCKRLIKSQIGDLESVDVEALRGLHVFDGACKTGTYLVAALEELTDFVCSVEESADRGAVKRRVASENIRGLEQDELSVQVARFRLALSIVAGDDSPRPLPDLRQIVKRGGTLSKEVAPAFPPEGPTIEYKASFDWDPRRSSKSLEMRFGCLRTVAAFMNSDGGTLYIGVSDSGDAVGLDGDFSLIADAAKEDGFEGRFREFMKNSLDPIPLNNVTLKFSRSEGVTVCAVDVRPSFAVTYLTHKDKAGQEVESVFVRDGNRTIELRGRARDAFVVSRSQS